MQQNNDSNDASGMSKAIPKFRGGMEFRTYQFEITQYLNGFMTGPGSAPFADQPEPYEDIPAIGNARNDRARQARNDLIRQWHTVEARCYQAVCVSVHGHSSAVSHLQRAVREAALPPGERLRTTAILAMYDAQYGAPSDHGLEHWQAILIGLKIKRGEPVASAILRLDDTVAEFVLQGGVYTDQQKKTKLASMLRNGEPAMNTLGGFITLQPSSYAVLCESLKFYDLSDEGKQRLRQDNIKGLRDATASALEDKPACTKCGSRFHAIDKCWQEHPELKKEYLKKKKTAFKAKKSVAKAKADKPEMPKKSFAFPKPIKTASMISDADPDPLDTDRIYLDTCASDSIFILTERRHFDKLSRQDHTIGCAERGAKLHVEGVGSMDGENNIYFCPNGRHNILSLSRLNEWGLGFLGDPGELPAIRQNQTSVLIGTLIRGMPVFDKTQLLALRRENLHRNAIVQAISYQTAEEKLQLWHYRLGHLPIPRIADAHRRCLIEGVNLPREAIMAKHIKASDHPCDACSLSRRHRHSFNSPNGSVYKDNWKPGEFIVSDYQQFLNTPSIHNYIGVWNFTDVATDKTFSYLCQNRNNFLHALKRLKAEELDPINRTCKKFRSDSDSAILANTVIEWFITNGIDQTSSPTDTPEMNSVAERAHAFLYPTTLALLLHGDMPKTFWEYAYLAASKYKGYVVRDTCYGHMTSDEAWYGKAPNVKYERVWGSKAWIQEPRSEARKDWHPRAVAGRLVGDSKLPIGWVFWVPEIQDFVTSVNAKFDEKIPSRAQQFRAELAPELTPVDPVERSLSDYKYLIHEHYIDPDDSCLYQVTRLKALKDRTIVGFVRPILAGHHPREARQPVHIASLAKMVADSSTDTVELERLLQGAVNHADTSVSALSCGPLTGIEEHSAIFHTFEERGGATVSAAIDGVDGLTVGHPTAVALLCPAVPAPDTTARGLIPPGQTEPQLRSDLLPGSSAFAHVHTAGHQPAFSPSTPSLNVTEEETPPDSLWPMELSLIEGFAFDSVPAVRPTPLTREEALASKYAAEWLVAEDAELRSIEKRAVVEGEVLIPKGVKPIKSRFVYKWKDADKPEPKAKVRWVAKGYSQTAGLDYGETFAPTGKNVLFRVLMLLVLTFGMKCQQIDVNTAFLYADIEKPVYMDGPPGYECKPGYCLKIQKCIYGLKQSPRDWHRLLRTFILGLGFTQSKLDSCIFFDNSVYGSPRFILIYVDDILIMAMTSEETTKLKRRFLARFECKDLGEIKRFLGMNVAIHAGDHIRLDQTHYAKAFSAKFAYLYAMFSSSRSTPLPYDTSDRLADESALEPDSPFYDWWVNFPYLAVIGSVLYLAINTRPDIIFHVCMLARYSKNKTPQACYLVAHLLSYIAGTVEFGLTYRFSDLIDVLNLISEAYSDADFAGDRKTRRSTAGYIVFAANAPIAWYSKLMSTVAASTMESEYMAAFHCAQEVVFIRNFLSEIGLPQTKPTRFRMDAQAAIDAIRNPVFHARTKHIAVKFRWIQAFVQENDKVLDISHVATSGMIADLLTKVVAYRIWLALSPYLVSVSS